MNKREASLVRWYCHPFFPFGVLFLLGSPIVHPTHRVEMTLLHSYLTLCAPPLWWAEWEVAPLAWPFGTCSPVGGSIWGVSGEVQSCWRTRDGLHLTLGSLSLLHGFGQRCALPASSSSCHLLPMTESRAISQSKLSCKCLHHSFVSQQQQQQQQKVHSSYRWMKYNTNWNYKIVFYNFLPIFVFFTFWFPIGENSRVGLYSIQRLI